MDPEKPKEGDHNWFSNLTTADGTDIKFDPLLLEEDQNSENEKDTDDEDGYFDDEVNYPFDELGRTPPRQALAKNRKWSVNKKVIRDSGKRIGVVKKGLPFNFQKPFSPKQSPRQSKQQRKSEKKFHSRNIIEEPMFDYESDSGSIKSAKNDMMKINTFKEEENADSYKSNNPSGFLRQQSDGVSMVETTSRFMSLSSRPVTITITGDNDSVITNSVPNSGCNTPRRKTSAGGKGRKEFYTLLSALYQSQKTVEKEGSSRHENGDAYERNISQEDTLWQNETKELIWLELQAWFAGKNLICQDNWIHRERTALDNCKKLVCDYKFVPFHQNFFDQQQISLESDIFYDAQESIERRLSDMNLRSEDSTSTLKDVIDDVDGVVMSRANIEVNIEDVNESLDIWCPMRISNTEKALEEVENILNKIEYCKKLFPSSKRLLSNNKEWTHEEFKNRVNVLCVWYNLTVQLHQKTAQLGRSFGIGKRKLNIPWPVLQSHKSSSNEGDSNNSTVNTDESQKDNPMDVPDCSKKSPVKIVKFQISDDISSTTSPSDSNNSTDSSSTKKQQNRLLSSKCQDLETSITSLNSSLDLSFGPEGLSPYRKYVEKLLKAKGLRKLIQMQHKETKYLLHRAKVALEKENLIDDDDFLSTSGHHDWKSHHLEEKSNSSLPEYIQNDEAVLKKFGCQNDHFQDMNLPSFRAVYLFLCRIPKDIILECLKIKLEQKPLEPSELSIRQLLRECKETLKIAVNDRQKYITRVRAAVNDIEKDKSFLICFDEEMEDFDSCLTKTLDLYLEYLKSFVAMIQADSPLLISTYQKSLLEQEWEFVKTTCPHIPGGEARASNTFCQLACGMFCSLGDFLRSGSDEIIKNMYDISDDIDEEDNNNRKILFEALRSYQTLFGEAREKAVKAISFAKLVRKDLEVSAEFSLRDSSIDPFHLMKRLEETNHVKVLLPNCDLQIFVPLCISNHQDCVLHLLDMHCGQTTSHIIHAKGYLVLVDSNIIASKDSWNGETISIRLKSAETIIAITQIKASAILLVAPNSKSLEARRKDFAKMMRDCLSLVKEQRATSQAIAESLDHLKSEALQLGEQICEEVTVVEEKCDSNNLDQYDKEALTRRMREILLQCYRFCFEYHKDLDRLITGKSSRLQFCNSVMKISIQWMNFVLKWCERGRGLKPDWASKGLDFLLFAANPEITKYLTEDEFENFKILAEKSSNHIMGDDPNLDGKLLSPNIHLPKHIYSNSRPSSPSRSSSREENIMRKLSPRSTSTESDVDKTAMPPPSSLPGTLRRKSKHRKSITPDECDNMASKLREKLPWNERVVSSIKDLESRLEEERKDVVGKVLDKPVFEDGLHIKARQVRFSWQRGVKIGQGTFGKVYTAINNETGDIMAMKEIPLQPNDHRTLRSVADELKIFESIHHPHLVKHFGVEIHREEMLIFMEYCPEGTLEFLVSSTETGLEEFMVRRYTRQLVEAITCLHENGVVHRDIKTANIFLTEELKAVKLGDFGCAVKIKAHTTMPGELQGFVGTQAYMAPEVFTRNMGDGHGRAADIWSVACVVLEMVQGTRPWANIHSNYQIMYKVGMGQSPEVPEKLSEEGKDFLSMCFIHDPDERATAQDLLSHNFTKIFDEDDNNPSIPLFASVSEGSEFVKTIRNSSEKK